MKSMFKGLFSKKIDSITMAALLVALSSLLSRFLGIFRDRILAGEFGAGDTLDIYYAAFRIPDLIFNLLVLGALSAGFIPILTSLIKDFDCKKEGIFHKNHNQEAWELSSNILNVLGLFLVLLSILGIAFSYQLIQIITPGFSEEKMALTAALTRIMFLSPLFLGISSILGGILQTFKRFFEYSLAPIFYNVGIIIGALYFVPRWGIYGLAWGVVLGSFLHMIIQIPTVFHLGFRYKPMIDLKNKNIRKIGVMMVPRTMSLAISQINLVFVTIVASTLQSGSLAIFNFANNLQSFPIGVFGISFAIAAFPTLSHFSNDREKFIDSFSNVFRQILFFIVPATVLLLTLRAQIIRVLLGVGSFDWQATVLTMNTLGFFIVSLFAQASLPLLIRVFYARHNSKTPFLIGFVVALVNVVFSLYFSDKFGVAGLSLAFSLSSILNFILLWVALRIDLENMDETRILISVSKFSVAGIFCGIAVQGSKLLVWPFIDMSKTLGVFTQGVVAGLAGILAYVLICALLKSEELLNFWSTIKGRLPFKKIEADDQGEARGV